MSYFYLLWDTVYHEAESAAVASLGGGMKEVGADRPG